MGVLIAVCGKNLSHAKGLKFTARIHSRVLTRLAGYPDSHLHVEAGQTDCVVILFFALSFLQKHNNNCINVTAQTLEDVMHIEVT